MNPLLHVQHTQLNDAIHNTVPNVSHDHNYHCHNVKKKIMIALEQRLDGGTQSCGGASRRAGTQHCSSTSSGTASTAGAPWSCRSVRTHALVQHTVAVGAGAVAVAAVEGAAGPMRCVVSWHHHGPQQCPRPRPRRPHHRRQSTFLLHRRHRCRVGTAQQQRRRWRSGDWGVEHLQLTLGRSSRDWMATTRART